MNQFEPFCGKPGLAAEAYGIKIAWGVKITRLSDSYIWADDPRVTTSESLNPKNTKPKEEPQTLSSTVLWVSSEPIENDLPLSRSTACFIDVCVNGHCPHKTWVVCLNQPRVMYRLSPPEKQQYWSFLKILCLCLGAKVEGKAWCWYHYKNWRRRVGWMIDDNIKDKRQFFFCLLLTVNYASIKVNPNKFLLLKLNHTLRLLLGMSQSRRFWLRPPSVL